MKHSALSSKDLLAEIGASQKTALAVAAASAKAGRASTSSAGRSQGAEFAGVLEQAKQQQSEPPGQPTAASAATGLADPRPTQTMMGGQSVTLGSADAATTTQGAKAQGATAHGATVQGSVAQPEPAMQEGQTFSALLPNIYAQTTSVLRAGAQQGGNPQAAPTVSSPVGREAETLSGAATSLPTLNALGSGSATLAQTHAVSEPSYVLPSQPTPSELQPQPPVGSGAGSRTPGLDMTGRTGSTHAGRAPASSSPPSRPRGATPTARGGLSQALHASVPTLQSAAHQVAPDNTMSGQDGSDGMVAAATASGPATSDASTSDTGASIERTDLPRSPSGEVVAEARVSAAGAHRSSANLSSVGGDQATAGSAAGSQSVPQQVMTVPDPAFQPPVAAVPFARGASAGVGLAEAPAAAGRSAASPRAESGRQPTRTSTPGAGHAETSRAAGTGSWDIAGSADPVGPAASSEHPAAAGHGSPIPATLTPASHWLDSASGARATTDTLTAPAATAMPPVTAAQTGQAHLPAPLTDWARSLSAGADDRTASRATITPAGPLAPASADGQLSGVSVLAGPTAATPAAAPAASAGQPSPHETSAATRSLLPPLVALASHGDGSHEITVSMSPKELGQVEVRLIRDADGATRITVSATNPDTLRDLSDNAHHLHAALDAASVPNDGRTLSFVGASHASSESTSAGQSSPNSASASGGRTGEWSGGSQSSNGPDGSGQGGSSQGGSSQGGNDRRFAQQFQTSASGGANQGEQRGDITILSAQAVPRRLSFTGLNITA